MPATASNLKRPSRQEQERAVEAWNREHAIGDSVEVTLDSGSVKMTQTRTEAQMLSGHTAVIWVEGIAGCVSLARVTSKTVAA